VNTSTPVSTTTSSVTPFQFRQSGSRGTAAWYVEPVLNSLLPDLKPGARVLDIGCGNGYLAGQFLERGCRVVGIDPSESGIRVAREAHPRGRFEVACVAADPLAQLGEQPFDLVISVEVIEHLYAPATWAEACFRALRPGGVLLCSTPYHGYLKNLILSLRGKWDAHWQPLNEGGHIKFWSVQTLSQLLRTAGFSEIAMRGAGRYPYLWKSMVLRASRPEEPRGAPAA
jgi:2-polyprenyl-3-methyl-5-hydroxy-6-metoxy-1,4-benzoquinol methylase